MSSDELKNIPDNYLIDICYLRGKRIPRVHNGQVGLGNEWLIPGRFRVWDILCDEHAGTGRACLDYVN